MWLNRYYTISDFFMAFSILTIVFKILIFFLYIGATLGPICEGQIFFQTVCSLPLGMLILFVVVER